MPKTRRYTAAHYYVLWALLGLLFLVQLSALALALTSERFRDQRGVIMIADAAAMTIGAGLAWMVWRARPRSARPYHMSRQAQVRTVAARPLPKEAVSPTPSKQTTPSRTVSGSTASRPAKPDLDVALHGDSQNVTAMLHQLTHKAQHDSLTGLPNRSLALDRLQQAISRAERHRHSVAVMFIDLNGFKPLNDTYGHDFGDKVLRKTAERLKRSIRGLDTVARLGGDEFLIILDQVDENKAMDTAQTLSTIVGQPVVAKQGPVCVGMSTGIAIYPKCGTAARQLLRAADTAMYQSKRQGGLPMLAPSATETTAAMTRTGRFNETTSINSKLLDTWEGTLRGLRTLSEPQSPALPAKRVGD